MENLSPNCIKIQKDGKDIYILGTAHVLADSKKEVEELINTIDPDTVCVELCDSRYQSLKDKDRWKNLDIIKVIRQGKGFLLFANMVLSSFQKRIGMDLESAPGEEMITAFQLAEAKNKKVVLADRDVNVTLRRAWQLSSFSDKMKILEVLMEALFTKEEIKKEDVKELMQGKDVMNEMMTAFAEKLPKAKEVLIDERDCYLAHRIMTAEGKTIAAVVGKGHLKGIQETIEKGFNYDPVIESVPPSGIGLKFLPWIFGLFMAALIAYGFFKGKNIGLSMLWAFIITRGVSLTLATLVVRAHPLTILSSWIAAVVKLIPPFISAPLLLTPIEASLRKPQVKDFEGLNTDIQTVKGFFSNRVTKILVLFVAVSLASYIGYGAAFIWMTILAAK